MAADGSVFMRVWIFKAKPIDIGDKNGILNALFEIPEIPQQQRPRRGDWPRFYAFTDTGYRNKSLHARIMKKFGELCRQRHPSAWCYLFVDQLSAHKVPTTVKDALEMGVMCWLLPANTSHFLQPLDDTIFAWFKKILGSSAAKIRLHQDASPLQVRMAMNQAGFEAEKKAFTDRVIQRSFQNNSLYPFDPDWILHLLDLNAGTNIKSTQESHIQVMICSVKYLFSKKKGLGLGFEAPALYSTSSASVPCNWSVWAINLFNIYMHDSHQ